MSVKKSKSSINHLLVDKNNNPYFFKNSKNYHNLLTAEIIEHPIYPIDNIFTSLAWDTEYTQPVGNLSKLTIYENNNKVNKSKK